MRMICLDVETKEMKLFVGIISARIQEIRFILRF